MHYAERSPAPQGEWPAHVRRSWLLVRARSILLVIVIVEREGMSCGCLYLDRQGSFH